MMQWALIALQCYRACVPQYVELYPTRTVCESKIAKDDSWISSRRMYCTPATIGETK